ncbi:MAG: tetratricopeptide repeat protein [Dehalococcoidia bacterium]
MSPDLPPDFAVRIKQLRGRLDLSQAALAGQLRVARQTVLRWERSGARPAVLAWQRFLQLEDVQARGGVSLADSLQPAEIGYGTHRAPSTDASPAPLRHSTPDTRYPLGNVPAQLSSFVGRARELAELEPLVRRARLLTLTGAGGSGKTRLALEVAAQVAGIGSRASGLVAGAVESEHPGRVNGPSAATETGANRLRASSRSSSDAPRQRPETRDPRPPSTTPDTRYPMPAFSDGVWLVELAALSDPALVPQAVAAALQVREESGRALVDTLTDFLQPRHLLLVIDNCEHLIEACARFIESYLRSCPRLHVLATSRETLGLAGEAGWRVPTLSIPGGSQPTTLDQLLLSESAQLFIERAHAIDPGFTVSTSNVAAIAQICRRLDGLPLAIELAAARIRVLTVEQIAERLDDCFRVLTHGSRTATPRQQTLRGAIDWSYALLSEAERALFNQLSVFAGGFSLDAAVAIHPIPSVLDLLERLVEKSLVLAEPLGGEQRYRLLEPLRQYAAEHMQESGMAPVVRQAHATYYLDLVEETVPGLFGPEQVIRLELLEREHENLRAAMGWSLKSSEWDLLLRLAGALWRFWYLHGHLTEGRSWLEHALQSSPTALPRSRALALVGAGILAWLLGDVEDTVVLHEQALQLCRAICDRRGQATALNMLGLVARLRRDYELATTCCTEALALSSQVEDTWSKAFSLYLLGEVAYFQGDAARPIPLWEESLSLFRGCGDRWGIAFSLVNLGNAARYRGDYDQASARFGESLELSRQLGNNAGIAYALFNLGEVARDRGDDEHATKLCEQSLHLQRMLADLPAVARSLNSQAGAELHLGNIERAAALSRESLQLAQHLHDDRVLAWCLEGAAELASARHQPECAARLHGAATALRDLIGAVLPSARRADSEALRKRLRAALGEARFSRAWTIGRALPLEQAIAVAMQAGAEGAQTEAPAEASALVAPSAYPDGLTARQVEVMRLIAAGRSNQEIAEELVVSVRTVEHHLTSIYTKIGARRKADAAAYALRHHL